MRFKYILFLILCSTTCLAQNRQILIGEQTIKFNDNAWNRPLTTEIWYPTTTNKPVLKNNSFIIEPTVINGKIPVGKHPLIMLSHGTGGGRLTMEWLADALVKQGFIVAAVDHWGNTFDNKIAINFVTPWQRAQDISYVITQLLKHPNFSKIINSKQIGAAGFSIGGYTTIALAGAKLDIHALIKYGKTLSGAKEIAIPEFPNLMSSVREQDIITSFRKSRSLKDNRIKAFFAMCPAIGQGFTNKIQMKDIRNPLYIVGAQSDSIAPIKTNALHYHKLIPKSNLYIVPGKTGHYVFLNEATPIIKKDAGVYFEDDPSVDRHEVHKHVGDLAIKFFKSYLKIKTVSEDLKL